MKVLCMFLLVLMCACEHAPQPSATDTGSSLPAINKKATDSTAGNKNKQGEKSAGANDSLFSNLRFRQVKVEKIQPATYRITGKAQVFEASFSWVVEDGHNELKQGYATTDAGAPQWGNFNFTIDVAKPNPARTLTLLLFEASPKDGSRQYELPVPLP